MLAPRQAALEAWLRNTENCTLYHGHARFVSARELRVGADVPRAERIFLDLGSRAAVPPIRGLDAVGYLTNVSMLDIDFLPPHLLQRAMHIHPTVSELIPTMLGELKAL